MKFYTIMLEGKFINSNFMREDSKDIVEAIKFSKKENAKYFFEGLRKDKDFKIIKVKCELEGLKES